MEITIEPGNPYDFTNEELDELAGLLRSRHPGTEVRIALRPERGYGVTLVEFVKLIVDVSTVVLAATELGKVLQTVVEWAQNRWQQDQAVTIEAKPRDRVVTLYDSNGKPLKEVRIQAPDGVPRYKDVDEQT